MVILDTILSGSCRRRCRCRRLWSIHPLCDYTSQHPHITCVFLVEYSPRERPGSFPRNPVLRLCNGTFLAGIGSRNHLRGHHRPLTGGERLNQQPERGRAMQQATLASDADPGYRGGRSDRTTRWRDEDPGPDGFPCLLDWDCHVRVTLSRMPSTAPTASTSRSPCGLVQRVGCGRIGTRASCDRQAGGAGIDRVGSGCIPAISASGEPKQPGLPDPPAPFSDHLVLATPSTESAD